MNHDISTTRRRLDDAIQSGIAISSETRAIAPCWVETLEAEKQHDYVRAVQLLERAIVTGELPDTARELLEARAHDFREAGMPDMVRWIEDRLQQVDMIRRREQAA